MPYTMTYPMTYSLIIHGGAGKGSKSFFNKIKKKDPAFRNLEDQYKSALHNITKIGEDMLKDGHKALDVVEVCCSYLEDNELFNAGVGASKDIEGNITHEATIVDGKTLNFGSVCDCNIINNPIKFAKLLLPHSLTLCGNKNIRKHLNNKHSNNKHLNNKHSNNKQSSPKTNIKQTTMKHFNSVFRDKLSKLTQELDTCGVVAMDRYGNIASGSSTGGLTNRPVGRIGDTHINGISTIADNNLCGICVSGCGEEIIKHHVASNVFYQMKYGNVSLKSAINKVLKECNNCGIVGIDKSGSIYHNKNTERMYIGKCSNKTDISVEIW